MISIEDYVTERTGLKYEQSLLEQNPLTVRRNAAFWIEARRLLDMSTDPEKYYRSTCISKSGTYEKRKLFIPSRELIIEQQFIRKKLLGKVPVSDCAYAYIKGKNIKQIAEKTHNFIHQKAGKENAVLIKVDIRNFFGSIKPWKVYQMYQQVFPQGTEAFWKFLTELTSLKGIGLPQGAPTSPVISNIAFYPVDKAIEQYVAGMGGIYCRYADDISVAFHKDAEDPKIVLEKLRDILYKNSYKLNDKKTSISVGGHFSMFGLSLDKPYTVRVRKNYFQQVRQEVHFVGKYGVEEHIRRLKVNGRKVKDTEEFELPYTSEVAYLRSLLGRIGYMLYVCRNPQTEEFEDIICSELARIDSLQQEWYNEHSSDPEFAILYEDSPFYSEIEENIRLQKTEEDNFGFMCLMDDIPF